MNQYGSHSTKRTETLRTLSSDANTSKISHDLGKRFSSGAQYAPCESVHELRFELNCQLLPLLEPEAALRPAAPPTVTAGY